MMAVYQSPPSSPCASTLVESSSYFLPLPIIPPASPAAEPVSVRLPVVMVGSSTRPRGRAPVVRTERGKSTGVSCVWNGNSWVPPGPLLSPSPSLAALPSASPSSVSADSGACSHHLPLPGTQQLVLHPSDTPRIARMAAPPPPRLALPRLLLSLGFEPEGTVAASHQLITPAALPDRPPPPPEVQELERRLMLAPSRFGVFPANTKQAQHNKVEAAMQEMGLADLLRSDESPQWEGTPDSFEVELEATLRARTRTRIARSTEPESLLYALGWYRIHRAAFPSIIPFQLLLGGDGDVAISKYNERTIMRIGELMRLYGSRKPGERGKTLATSSIAAVQSTFRGLCTREIGYELELRGGRQGVKRQLKDMRREDGPRAAIRRKREGFKAQHFELAAQRGFNRSTRFGVHRFATMHFCHNAVARGASAGVRRSSDVFDPQRGLTCADIVPDTDKSGLPGLVAYVFPGKDCENRHVKRPIPISSRPPGQWLEGGSDPRDAYQALMAEYELMLREVPEELRAVTPFFRKQGLSCPSRQPTWRPLPQNDGREACGFSREDHELAHEFRVGGASGLFDMLGMHGKQVLIDRGRWSAGSDIAFIYARTSAESQYEASILMEGA